MGRPDLDYYVLDAISFDAGQLDEMVAFLSAPDSQWMFRFERPPQRLEVQAALMRLVRDGSVEVAVSDPEAAEPVDCGPGVWPARPVAEMFFDLTGRGRVRYLNWDD